MRTRRGKKDGLQSKSSCHTGRGQAHSKEKIIRAWEFLWYLWRRTYCRDRICHWGDPGYMGSQGDRYFHRSDYWKYSGNPYICADCAPIAVDTRVTLYSYLGKTLGPYIQKIYNFVWGLASIAMAASMLTVSASAVREIFGIAIQTEWYPTDIKFIAVVVVLGIIVTLVAANGFEAVAKFSSVCAPWMIVVFAAGIFVGIPQLMTATGGSGVHSFSDFMTLLNTSVWNGQVMEGGQKLSILHVIGFAWMCNLAYHGGLNDMALFRYAKSAKYGFVTSYGMFVGHFFAWGSAGVMGATAAILLNQSLLVLDSGAITSVVLGGTGLLAVIIAGWTTANPNIYRASLAFQTLFGKVSIKKLTYVVGVVIDNCGLLPNHSEYYGHCKYYCISGTGYRSNRICRTLDHPESGRHQILV